MYYIIKNNIDQKYKIKNEVGLFGVMLTNYLGDLQCHVIVDVFCWVELLVEERRGLLRATQTIHKMSLSLEPKAKHFLTTQMFSISHYLDEDDDGFAAKQYH